MAVPRLPGACTVTIRIAARWDEWDERHDRRPAQSSISSVSSGGDRPACGHGCATHLGYRADAACLVIGPVSPLTWADRLSAVRRSRRRRDSWHRRRTRSWCRSGLWSDTDHGSQAHQGRGGYRRLSRPIRHVPFVEHARQDDADRRPDRRPRQDIREVVARCRDAQVGGRPGESQAAAQIHDASALWRRDAMVPAAAAAANAVDAWLEKKLCTSSVFLIGSRSNTTAGLERRASRLARSAESNPMTRSRSPRPGRGPTRRPRRRAPPSVRSSAMRWPQRRSRG